MTGQAEASGAPAARLVRAAGIDWHVRIEGQGPVLMLLHGTGASGASWRHLAPILRGHFTLVVPDLPGHGSTSPAPGRASLPVIADGLARLAEVLGLLPVFLAGHSAGAAIGARMSLIDASSIRRQAWVGAALRPFGGLGGHLATPLARLLAGSAILRSLAVQGAGRDAAVRRLIQGTGSRPTAEGIAVYGSLLRQPSHVAGALAMMANWDLQPLWAALPGLQVPVLLLHGVHDRAVALAQSREAARRLPHARLVPLEAGHLAHEEDPGRVGALLLEWFLGDRDPAR